jgi:hypothetical protein
VQFGWDYGIEGLGMRYEGSHNFCVNFEIVGYFGRIQIFMN